jgi:hypothetical protein
MNGKTSSRGYVRLVLAMLPAVYTSDFLDRQILWRNDSTVQPAGIG